MSVKKISFLIDQYEHNYSTIFSDVGIGQLLSKDTSAIFFESKAARIEHKLLNN